MNESQKETIVSLLSEELAKHKAEYDTALTHQDSSLIQKASREFDHLWETLNAFQDICNNQQMVKEASNE